MILTLHAINAPPPGSLSCCFNEQPSWTGTFRLHAVSNYTLAGSYGVRCSSNVHAQPELDLRNRNHNFGRRRD